MVRATSRRTLLVAAAAAATAPLGRGVAHGSGPARAWADRYPSNTAIYADPSLVEGVDYGRRYRRHAMVDGDAAERYGFAKTTVAALHGGGIEVGTSELCLAIAGYHPASLSVTPAGATTYDYWMFEGLRPENNSELHVTATRCDDGIAAALCAGSRNVLSLHGCTAATAGLPEGTRATLVGGRNARFKRYLIEEYTRAGFRAVDAAGHETLNGDEPDNIVNRTLLGMGGQLEITTPQRAAMFRVNTGTDRRHTTTQVFWSFVNATRAAIARLEAGQVVL